MERRAHRPGVDGGAIRLADLPQDLPFPKHQALEAGRNPEQVVHDAVVVVAHQVRGEEIGLHTVQLHQHVRKRPGAGNLLVAAGDVNLDPVAGREHHELIARERLRQQESPLPYLAASNASASRIAAGAER